MEEVIIIKNSVDTFNTTIQNNQPRTYLEIKVAGGIKGDRGVSGGVDIIYYVCGETIPSHTPVVLVANLLFKLDNTNPLHQFSFVGFSETSGIEGQSISVLRNAISLTGWNLTPDRNYFASTGGVISLTPPATGFTRIIAFSQDTNTLLVVSNYIPINRT